jgi:hypothetical protein
MHGTKWFTENLIVESLLYPTTLKSVPMSIRQNGHSAKYRNQIVKLQILLVNLKMGMIESRDFFISL